MKSNTHTQEVAKSGSLETYPARKIRTRNCSRCEGVGAIKVFHMQKICSNCNLKKDHAVHSNQDFETTNTINNCPFCKSLALITTMRTVVIDCPLCQGTGNRNWTDIIMRPYNKANIKNKILNAVIARGK